MHVLVGVTGGIAACKAPAVISKLQKQGCDVRVVLTEAAARFVSPLTFQSLTGNPVGLDLFSEQYPKEIHHISWAQWADAALVVPATANTISKLACGIADNLLTSMLLAFTGPLMLAPAMNCEMYASPATQRNLRTLEERGVRCMEPANGLLACGDTGKGRLPEPDAIVEEFLAMVGGDAVRHGCKPLYDKTVPHGPLQGKTVTITAGPTREPIDPVRYLSNRSSGKMGYALAEEARDMGASVILISGPVELEPPEEINLQYVETALEMRMASLAASDCTNVFIGCAAVSDYRPEHAAEQKIKKTEELVIRLVKNPDILAELGKRKHFYLAGFAAETTNLEQYALEKLRSKNLDLIAANDVSDPDIGFNSDRNAVLLLKRDGERIEVPAADKHDVARRILEEIAADLEAKP